MYDLIIVLKSRDIERIRTLDNGNAEKFLSLCFVVFLLNFYVQFLAINTICENCARIQENANKKTKGLKNKLASKT